MYDKIQILPDFIANQIAAGEVVQRPESVVKELVENSFDSGADSVAVFVKDAGKQLIHIVDNGNGISKEDLPLTIKRHATSKILTQDDLEKILSFGFRGEALASISSVANLEIRTKKENEAIGYKLTSEPNKQPELEPGNFDKGTQVFVRNLFYNIPARRKFLKSNLTEFRHISETMMKFALSKPDVRLTFYDDDHLIFDYKAGSFEKRLKDIFGEEEFSSFVRVMSQSPSIAISGYVGRPAQSKQNRNTQYMFLNGRFIVSKSLGHAIYSCFEHFLDKNYFPIFVLNIEIDPTLVDVNVHPQKHEVKFEDERMIYNVIKAAVSQALRENNITPALSLSNSFVAMPFEKMSENNGNEFVVNRSTGEIVEQRFNDFSTSRPNAPINNGGSIYDFLFGAESNQSANQNSAQTSIDSNQSYSSLKEDNVWQLHNKYIFFETEKGVLIVDMHNAHERVLYEKAIRAMNKDFSISQNLIFPVNCDLSNSQKTLLLELQNDLQDLGYTIEISSAGCSIISVPSDIKAGNEEKSLKDILDSYDEFQEIRHSDKRDNLAATFACKSAVKTGQRISKMEMLALIENLMKCEIPYVCPHGRPVILDLSLADFDKQFGRTS